MAGERYDEVQIVLASYGNHALLRLNTEPVHAILLDERSLARLILEGQLLLWQMRGFPVDRRKAGE